MGHHNRVFNGDRFALHGAWSPPTSAANFCEEDYLVTRYIAEFINTLTNLTYVILALRSMYRRGGSGSSSSRRGLFSPRCDFMSVSLLLVGLGSTLYHGTLRQTLQFADDISMLVLGAAMLHGAYAVRQTPARARLTALLVCVPVAAFSAFYVRSGNIVYHTAAFVSQMLLLTVQSFHLFYRATPRFDEDKVRQWKRGQRVAIAVTLAGYFLWNIDLEFCAELRHLREQVGMPWAFVLELHGWWHVLTAVGAARFMDVVRDMHVEVERERGEAALGKDE